MLYYTCARSYECIVVVDLKSPFLRHSRSARRWLLPEGLSRKKRGKTVRPSQARNHSFGNIRGEKKSVE